MSGFDVEPEDMTRASVVDEKLTALLMGQAPAEGDELASELSWMIEHLDTAFPPLVVSEQVKNTHLARMMEVAAELPRPGTSRLAPVHVSLLDRLRAGLSRKVAAATLASTAAFGGAAYAGVLPAPVQEAISDAAALVGLHLPKPVEGGTDQDTRDLEEGGDHNQLPNDAASSGVDRPPSGGSTGSDGDELDSKGDDPGRAGEDDGQGPDSAASDDRSDQPESGDGPDSDQPEGGDEPDSDQPEGGDEPDSDQPEGGDEPDSDQPESGDEPDNDQPESGNWLGTEEADLDSPDSGLSLDE